MPKRQRTPAFVQMFKQAVEQMLCEGRVTPVALRVWLLLVVRCEWGNWVEMTQRDIGRRLHMDRSVVARSLRALVRAGLVIPEVRQGMKGYRYRLSRTFIHHGAVKEVRWRQQHEPQTRRPSMSVS